METHLINAILADAADLGTLSTLSTLGQVIIIDVMLAADNAIVVGALAAGLDPVHRNRVIAIGTAAALLLRICFALLAAQLMRVPGLVLVGGLLLVWVGAPTNGYRRSSNRSRTARPRLPRA